MNTPIVLIIFNRPTFTLRVFDIIRKVKPQELFIVSDGPRGEYEETSVNDCREIVSKIDWPCRVYKKFEEKNLGCQKSVSSGLDWVFSKTPQAIILEDDCLPDITFFTFCHELLNKYKTDYQVMMISGNNYIGQKENFSYGFCRHSLIWGWATWRRAWNYYKEVSRSGLPAFKQNYGRFSKIMSPIRLSAIKKTLMGKIDTWDYVWQLAMLLHNGLCIYPCVNLVRNIGFGKDATHTKTKTFHSSLFAGQITFPLIHPSIVKVSSSFDAKIEKTYHPLFMLWDILKGLILR